MKGKSSDLSLSAVLLLLFLAITSYIVIAVNETNYTDNASDDVLNTDINLTVNDTTEIIIENLTENNTIENITSEINLTEAINETNKTISLNLKYKKGSNWDKDNNGLESITGLIDLDVSNTEFSWEADESKLCTKWEVYSLDIDNITRVCYGSEKCCALADLKPALSSWKDALELYMGRYGASSFNIITAQVIYADYNLSIDEPFSEFYNSNTEKLAANFSQEKPEIKFDRDIICDKCSNHKASPLAELVMVVKAGISSYIDGILADYFPSSFTVINAIGGVITNIDENYSKIEWNVSGTNISKSYILLSPNRTNPTSKYYFHSELNNQTSDEWMVVVADPGTEVAEKECVLPDVAFSVNDLQTSSDTAILSKNGVSITLRGVKVDSIKKLPEFKDGVLTVDSSISMKNATLSIPHCGIKPVMVSPKLYVRENKDDFKIAEPYCNGNDCFNTIKITPISYVFNVEHFTDYTINSTGGFETLAACLKYINNSANSCYITEKGYYDIHKWQINASENSFGRAGLKLALDFDFNQSASTSMTYDASDSKNNGTVNGAAWNTTGYYGGAYELDGANDYINLSDINLTNKNYTIEAWIKATSTTISSVNYPVIIGKGNFDWSFGLYDGYVDIWINNVVNFQSANQLAAGKWHHIAYVLNGTKGQIYINGKIDNTGVIGYSTEDTGPVNIGFVEGYDYFGGTIDQIRVYNRSLSQSEIEQQYAGNIQKYNLSGDGIVINSANITLNCNGSTIKGDGTNNDEGVYYLRQGGNITVEHCIMEGFSNNFDIDALYDADNNITILNCTSANPADIDIFSYASMTIKKFNQTNSKGLYVSQETADNGLYEDILITNCSGLLDAGMQSCLYVEMGDNNIFRRINLTTTSAPPDNLKSAVIFISGAEGNIFEDSYVKANIITAINISSALGNIQNNVIRNTTIVDSKVGINIQIASNDLINNTIRNTTEQAIIYDSAGLDDSGFNITNNTIINAGTARRNFGFAIGDTTYSYGGHDFDQNTPRIYKANLGSYVDIDANDKNVSTIVTGSNNFTLCLANLTGIGLPFITIYVEQPMSGELTSCQAVADYYSGTLYLNATDYLGSNGAISDYSVNTSVAGLTIHSGADPAYLRFQNDSSQEAFPVEINTGNNWANITGNTIEITDGRENYGSMNITGNESYAALAWLNNFYSSLPFSSGNVYFCNNGEGNFYEESLDKNYIMDVLDDCGISNVTGPNGGETFDKTSTTMIAVNWTKQSSQNDIFYYLYYSNNAGGSWDYIDSTAALTYDWDISSMPAGSGYLVKIIPYDSYYNATNDQSDNTFTISTSLNNNWVCSNPATCEYQTITAALDGENNTANTIYIMGSNEVYTASKTASYNISPASNSTSALQINVSNITLDCQGAQLKGSGSGYGISIYNQSNNTIKNCNVTNYLYGMQLRLYSTNNTLVNNVANNNTDRGIYLRDSSNNSLINNTANSNKILGIFLRSSSKNNILWGNTITSNGQEGIEFYISSDNNILINNTANLNTYYGITLSDSSNNNLTNNIANNNTYYGIFLYGSSNNNLINNIANSNGARGIFLYMSANNNIIAQNNVNSNTNYGILLWNSLNNTIINNNIDSNVLDGLYLYNYSSNNIVVNNSITSSDQGIHLLGYCNNNSLTNNTIRLSDYGIYFWTSSNNNLINNRIRENNKAGIFVRYNSDSNNITKNILNNSATGSYDLNISTSDSGNNMVWLNNFSGNGVTNSGTNTIFCVNGQGNYYGQSAARALGECQLDVYNFSVVYSEGQFRIFKFKTKNIDTQTNSVNYTSLNTSENNINTSEVINLNSSKEVFTFVDYSYIVTGVFKVTAYANSTITDDEDKINVTI